MEWGKVLLQNVPKRQAAKAIAAFGITAGVIGFGTVVAGIRRVFAGMNIGYWCFHSILSSFGSALDFK